MGSLSEQDKNKYLNLDIPELVGPPLLKNFPGNLNEIDWRFSSPKEYLEVEEIMTNDVVFFEPFLVEDFYPQDMFDELVEILTSNNLKDIDYSHQMNKWEQGVEIPQKFIDYAVEKIRNLVGTEDIEFGYHMYAHHQITSEGRIPKLPLHIDWSPGPYMIDLHIGGNRDWGFVARYKNFITKPNQAIICQPQFDYHYRPAWNNDDPSEYYQALFFHLVNKNHWSCKTEKPGVNRPKHLEEGNEFGQYFRDSEKFGNFQRQRRYMFENYYLKSLYNSDAPDIPWEEKPTAEESNIHERKGVLPKVEMENK
jgi:hypothetical protein